VELRSTPGYGSSFQIKIPLTLAIVSALIVEAGGERYAIPQLAVAELVRARETSSDAQRIERLGNAPVLRLRDRLLPLIGLCDVLHLNSVSYSAEDDRIIIVTQVEGENFGIFVDRIFDTEEIVVKPMAPLLRSTAVFAGNTILGDGSVIMILDPKGVAALSGAQPIKEQPSQSGTTEADAIEHTDDMLLIAKAGDDTPIAVRLSDISRLEEIDFSQVEMAQGCMSIQYRGQLMPLLQLGSFSASRRPVLVFAENGRNVGLIVDEIVDIVEQAVDLEWSGNRPGILGTAVVAGRAADLLDVAYHTMPLFQGLAHKQIGRAA
jgi:two-component system chemotaxis sensor kinase CheA